MGCLCPPSEDRRLFCPHCGKVRSLDDLKSVNLSGFVGWHQSLKPSMEKFRETGDPDVFASGQT